MMPHMCHPYPHMSGQNSVSLGKAVLLVSHREGGSGEKACAKSGQLSSLPPSRGWTAHMWVSLLLGGNLSVTLFLLALYRFPSSFFSLSLSPVPVLFSGTRPGHVQTPTIQQCWRVDSIYLNNGSFFSILFNPQFR